MTTDEKPQDSLSQSQNSLGRSEFLAQKQKVEVSPMESSKRRSRSLSELPGHLRVPVLRRKDTERTQARLEAGVAGLAELRLLKEKQMALVEQTVTASIRQKQIPLSQRKLTRSSENLDYGDAERNRDQVDTGIFQPWQSTTSLCSITEEASAQMSHSFGRDRSTLERLRGGSLCLRSYGQSTGSTESHRSYQQRHPSRHRENHQTYSDPQQMSQQRWRQAWQEHDDFSKETKSDTQTESLKRVYENKTKTEDARQWPNLQCQQENINTNVQYREPNLNFSQDKRQTKASSSVDAGSVQPSQYKIDGQKNNNSYRANRFNHKRAASVDTPYILKQTQNSQKKMSWDNLLVLAGLQPKIFESDDNEGDDVFSQSLNTSYTAHSNQSPSDSEDHCTYLPFNDEVNENIRVNMKKGRSQSFCFDNSSYFKTRVSFNSHNKNGALDKMDTETKDEVQSDLNEDAFAPSNKSQNDNEAERAKAIIRRASIQCETVLTGARTRTRKIFNPLHEIDVVALQSPGPLHAVTLQYKSIPLNALPEDIENIPVRGRSASVCSFSYGDVSNDAKSESEYNSDKRSNTGNQLLKYEANKRVKQHLRHGLQPILENLNKTSPETFVNTRHENDANDQCGNQLSCKLLSEYEAKSDQSDGLNKTLMIDRIESTSPKDESLLITTQSCHPSLSVTELKIRENSTQPVPSSRDFDSEMAISCPPSETPDKRNQYDTLTSISSPRTQELHLCQNSSSPDTNEVRSLQTPDESLILSDDGYSTCDSIAPQSRLSIGPAYSCSSNSTSDWSSLSSGSVSNVSVASVFLPSSGTSSFRRNQGFRHLRYLHPPKSIKAGSDVKSKSCSAMNPPSPALSHVSEALNSEMTQRLNEPFNSKESTEDCALESLPPSLAPQSTLRSDESVQNFDSVFVDDLSIPVMSHANHEDSVCKRKILGQTTRMASSDAVLDQIVLEDPPSIGDETKSSIYTHPLQNKYAVLEKGTVIYLKLNTDLKTSADPKNNSITRTQKNPARIRVTPNKNVRQTAV